MAPPRRPEGRNSTQPMTSTHRGGGGPAASAGSNRNSRPIAADATATQPPCRRWSLPARRAPTKAPRTVHERPRTMDHIRNSGSARRASNAAWEISLSSEEASSPANKPKSTIAEATVATLSTRAPMMMAPGLSPSKIPSGSMEEGKVCMPTPPSGPGAQLRGTGRRRSPRSPGSMPHGTTNRLARAVQRQLQRLAGRSATRDRSGPIHRQR